MPSKIKELMKINQKFVAKIIKLKNAFAILYFIKSDQILFDLCDQLIHILK